MKRELLKKGFLFELSKFNENTTSIIIPVQSEQFERKKMEVSAVVNIVEIHFKRSN